jgi:sodium/bile acid cotransporter 7
MQKCLKKHAFILWLLFAVVIAIIFPAAGAKGGFFHSELTTQFGIWIIFFFQGLSLPTRELKIGYKPKRLHVFVLTWNYLLFPGLMVLLLLPLRFVLLPELRLGFYLLAILPTTVSSAVVFTTISGGETSNAIFATIFSNLLSILLVPTVVLAYLSAGTELVVPLSPLFVKLFILLALPLIAGQVIRNFLNERSVWVSERTKNLGNWIIVFIVHCAFAQSMKSGFLSQLSATSILTVMSITVFVLLVSSRLVWLSSVFIEPTREQRITAFFCASQKSLASGLPLITSIMVAAPWLVDGAAVLIPLLCYHPAQLVLAGLISDKWAQQKIRS